MFALLHWTVSCTWFSSSRFHEQLCFADHLPLPEHRVIRESSKIIQCQSNQYTRQPWKQLCDGSFTVADLVIVFLHTTLDILADILVDVLYLLGSYKAQVNFKPCWDSYLHSHTDFLKIKRQKVKKLQSPQWWLLPQEKFCLHKGCIHVQRSIHKRVSCRCVPW